MTLATPRAANPRTPTTNDLDPEFLRFEALRRQYLSEQCFAAVAHDEPFLYEGQPLTSGRAVDFARSMASGALVYATLAAGASTEVTDARVRRAHSAMTLALLIALTAILVVAWVAAT